MTQKHDCDESPAELLGNFPVEPEMPQGDMQAAMDDDSTAASADMSRPAAPR